MSMNNDGWILMSERKPTQYPVWLYDGEATDGFKTWMHCNGTLHLGATHWKPAAADIPAPPREQAREEQDEAALGKWMQTPESFCLNQKAVWHAALAYERAEVGKMLPQIERVDRNGQSVATVYDRSHQSACEAIRARCGGGK